MSIAQNIVEIVEEVLQENNASKVSKVFVEIGELMAIVPDSLDFCYRAITEGTRLEGSRLMIKEVAVTVHCENCYKDSRIEGFVFQCPFCNSQSLRIITGKELAISEIEVE
jgi:hydrogenase nickel incorporation protein HypA/HybF